MSETPTVTLAGVTGQGATSYDWELYPGTRPRTRSYTISDPDGSAQAAVERVLGTFANFVIRGPRKTLTIQNAWALGIYPGDRPRQFKVSMADNRITWPRKWISAAFNMRRSTGEKFLVNDEVIENAILLPSEEYAPYSINALAQPYTVTEVLEEVFFQLGMNWRYKNDATKNALESVPIENLQLDDNGSDALERVLAYLPGADVHVAADGFAVVYDTAEILAPIPASKQTVGKVFTDLADLRGLRPRYVNVWFSREVECNFVFRGAGATVTEDSNTLVNVIQVSASSLTIDGRKYARGSWVLFDDWLTAVNAEGTPSGKPLTDELIRKTYMGGRLSALAGILVPYYNDAVWLRRIDAIRAHYRRSFMVERVFWSRIAGMRPVRAHVLNYALNARAPSEAYCDYMRRPSMKAHNYLSDVNTDHEIGWAVRGYNADLSQVKPAPVRVTVVDPGAGILRLEPLLDPEGNVDGVTLGYPADGFDLPSNSMSELNLKQGIEMFQRWDTVHLDQTWNLRVILTLIPATPNNMLKHFKIRVTPQDTVYKKLGECTGPPVDVRVFPGVLTARMSWSDAIGPQIVDAIKGEGRWPDDRAVNPKQLQDVARAYASRVYEPLIDRPYGGATIDMDPDFEFGGNMVGVRHEMTGGACRTRVSYGAPRQARAIWRYLDSSTRRQILRNLNTPGSDLD